MKRLLTILALLAFVATAQAKSYTSKDYSPSHGFSFTSLESLIQDISLDFNKKQKDHGKSLKFDFDWNRLLKDFDKKFDQKDFKKTWDKFFGIKTPPPSTRVPDGGASLLMLGLGLLALAGLKRTVRN